MSKIYYKIIGNNHGTFNYHLGLNTLEENGEIFDDSSSCTAGGLYYTTKKYIWKWLSYGNKICKLRIPDDARQVEVRLRTNIQDKKLFKSDKIIILDIQDICLKTIIDWEIPMMSIKQACQYGYLDIVVFLYQGRDQYKVNQIDVIASRYGMIHILEWWFDHIRWHVDPPSISFSVDSAASNGHLPVLELWWLKSKELFIEFTYTYKAMDAASHEGYIHVLDWFFDKYMNHNIPLRYTCMAMDHASYYDKINVLDWWLDKCIKNNIELKFTPSAMLYASHKGYVHILDWWVDKHVHYNVELKYNEIDIKLQLKRFQPKVVAWWKNFLKNKSKIKHEIKLQYVELHSSATVKTSTKEKIRFGCFPCTLL